MSKITKLVNDLVSQERWDEAYNVLTQHVRSHKQDAEAKSTLGILMLSIWDVMEKRKKIYAAPWRLILITRKLIINLVSRLLKGRTNPKKQCLSFAPPVS